MTGRCTTRRTSRLLAPVLFFLLSGLLSGAAQSAEDGLAPIASALQNQEFQKALELLRPALRASPGNAQLWAMQGAAFAGEGHTKEALASFRSAQDFSGLSPSVGRGDPNRVRGRGCGRDSTLAAHTAIAADGCDQSRHARGTGVSA